MAEIRKNAAKVGKTAVRLGRDIGGMFISARDSHYNYKYERERAGREMLLQRLRNERTLLQEQARIAKLRRQIATGNFGTKKRRRGQVIIIRQPQQQKKYKNNTFISRPVQQQDIIIRKKRNIFDDIFG